MGKINNKSILDLGCGHGYYARLFAKLGAKKILGIDISKKMIQDAKMLTKNCPTIKYLVGDMRTLPTLGKFDLVLAIFSLHYAKTCDELYIICENIYKNLIKNGHFYAFIPHPTFAIKNNKQYNFSRFGKKPLKDADKMKFVFYDAQKPTEVVNYFWSRKTYQKILKKVGFKNIVWITPTVSNQGLIKFGQEYWKNYLDHPNEILIECTK